MCGIAGIFDLRGRRPVDPALIRRMTDAIAHRGPDGEGFHVEPGLALGHRRLSIIDVAGGAQPIFNETGDVCVTYNGELYNYRDLTRELLAHPEVERAIDPLAVEDFFAYGYVPEPRTIYSGIHKLAAGHCLSVRRGASTPTPRRYWDVRFDAGPPRALEEAADALIANLRRSVVGELMSEVPLGAFLSGGIDSSAVVAMMAGAAPNGIDAFTIGYDDPRFARS